MHTSTGEASWHLSPAAVWLPLPDDQGQGVRACTDTHANDAREAFGLDRQPAVRKAWFGTRLDYAVGHVARSPVHLAELRRSRGLRFVALLPEHPAYHEQQGDSAGALSLTRHLVTVSPDGSRMPGVLVGTLRLGAHGAEPAIELDIVPGDEPLTSEQVRARAKPAAELFTDRAETAIRQAVAASVEQDRSMSQTTFDRLFPTHDSSGAAVHTSTGEASWHLSPAAVWLPLPDDQGQGVRACTDTHANDAREAFGLDRQPAVRKAWFGTRLDYAVGHVARSPVHLAELRRSRGLRFVALLPEHPAYHEQQGDSAGALSLTRHLVTVSPDGSRMPGVGAIQGSVVPTSKSPHR